DRLEERVREAEQQQVLHRLLAEVVIDAEHRRLLEHPVNRHVQRVRGLEVAAEGLLDDDARPLRAADRGDAFDDDGERARRNGEIEEGTARALELLTERLERRAVAIV